MKQNMDVVAQGIAAIRPYLRFIAARRRDADEEAAQIQPKASAPSVPLWGSGSTAPLPAVTHTEPETVGAEDARPDAPRATTFTRQSGSEREVSREVQVTPLPFTPSLPPTDHLTVPPETTLPSTSVPLPVAEAATADRGPLEGVSVSEEASEVDVSEAPTLPEPSTGEAARAQFETIWRMSPPERIPRMVREAYAERDRAPDYFAQKLIGAVREGLVPPALEAAVATLIRLDSHFQEADLLAHTPGHDQLFQIELQEEDYHADDSGLSGDTAHLRVSVPSMEDDLPQGEADRAALRGDAPF